jgi:hypothetical protein
MKAEVRSVQGDGLDDAEDAIKINEEDMVRQDFALFNGEDSKMEETLPEVTENAPKADTECQEVVTDTGHRTKAGSSACMRSLRRGT